MSCPWNGDDSNLKGVYSEKRLLASIPVYQKSLVLPNSCYNTDSGPNSFYHLPLDHMSFQIGRSKLYDSWFNVWRGPVPGEVSALGRWQAQRVSFNKPLREFDNTIFNQTNVTGRHLFDTSIPNPANNITRMYYNSTTAQQVDGVTDAKDLGTLQAMVNSINGVRVDEDTPTSGFPYQIPIFDSNRQYYYPDAALRSGITQGQQDPAYSVNWNGFPRSSNRDIESWWLQAGYFHQFRDKMIPLVGSARFDVLSQTALSLTVPDFATLPFSIPGCERQGCLFKVSVTVCASSTVMRYSETEYENRFAYPTGAKHTTGCGIVSSHLYKIQADPGYRNECCLRNFTPDMEQSTTIFDQFAYGLNISPDGQTRTSYSEEIVAQQFPVAQVYCDPSWAPGNAACDVELQSACGFSLSMDENGQLRNSTVVTGTPCQQWYAGVMKDLADNGFTRRNFDVVNDFITRYCAQSATQDPLSCACVTGINPRNDGYWGVYEDAGQTLSLSLLATKNPVDGQFSGVYFTDPLCSSVQCRTDPAYFSLLDDEGNNQAGPQVLISPSILFAKKQCPQGMCFLINEGSTVNASQVRTRQQVNIANVDFMCSVGGAVVPPVGVDFDVTFQSRDSRGDIVGQYSYNPTTGIIQDGAAIINLTLVFAQPPEGNPPDASFDITIVEGGNTSYFTFSSLAGVYARVSPQNSVFSLPALVPRNSNQLACNAPCYGTYYDEQLVSVQFTILSKEITKQFPVRVLLYPTTPRPPNISSTQEQVFNSPVEIPKPSISRTTMVVIFLCGILVFYSIIFLLEIAEILSIRGRVIQQFSPPPL